jgi:hypothetical protein
MRGFPMSYGQTGDRSRDPQPDLREVPENEIFGEIRRRKLPQWKVEEALDIKYPKLPQRRDIRLFALVLLSGLTLILIVFIGILAVENKPIPDLLSGLAGSGIGGIAGILSGRGDGAEPSSPVPS